MEQLYTQCKLRRIHTEQIAWIPSELAIVGKLLKIRNVHGWKVIEVIDAVSRPESYFHRFGHKDANEHV